jgi:hypothetical protein
MDRSTLREMQAPLNLDPPVRYSRVGEDGSERGFSIGS